MILKFVWGKQKGSRIKKPLWHFHFCRWLKQPSLGVWVFAALMWLRGSGVLPSRNPAALCSHWTSVPLSQYIQTLWDLKQYVCINKQIIPGTIGDSYLTSCSYLLKSISMVNTHAFFLMCFHHKNNIECCQLILKS